ncbi:MAG: GCN5-related N-acetyltransferase [uncultured Thermomicrobiales bacterium]|uniref:GCN5-related N-acetyltransferase n=1 Tax=uncultured Thermomicrobiales bacterium TaxID=1645740 RepID=A0A6J4UK13_9BACT|nr:MAG: GCN5-related N-acetyltransferase [uncultured Thermomicrobiales bacterium]
MVSEGAAGVVGVGAGSHERPIVTIEGELVVLGPHRRDLVPTYQRWVNDLETLRNLAIPPRPMTLEAESAWYDSLSGRSDDINFTVYERATWRPVGNASLHAVDHRNRSATFGILIGEADCRGRGLGTEVTRLMLDYAFTALGLHNVMLTVYEFNHAAQRAYQKAGFRELGRRRQCRMMGGRLWDEVYMECLASEFESPRLAALLKPDERRA